MNTRQNRQKSVGNAGESESIAEFAEDTISNSSITEAPCAICYTICRIDTLGKYSTCQDCYAKSTRKDRKKKILSPYLSNVNANGSNRALKANVSGTKPSRETSTTINIIKKKERVRKLLGKAKANGNKK